MSVIDDALDALFYGSGAWFGILLFYVLIIGLLLKWKYSGVLLVPVTVFMAIDYLSNSLLYHGALMLLTTIFILGVTYKQLS